MKWVLHRAADVTGAELSALQSLTHAVYPPPVAAVWPGNAVEWAQAQWRVIGWNDGGDALCHVGVFLRDSLWNERPVKIGGIGGVKTHPAARGQGLAAAAIDQALHFFREMDVDFALLVCEPDLIPFYERLGWRRFQGNLLVTQKENIEPFTFDLPMTMPLRLQESLGGVIDLLGPPW
jgi:GNAT superfamily N-acetyltransferase